MSALSRPARPEELPVLWPVIESSHVMTAYEEFVDYHAEAPWRVRVTQTGSAMLLGRWREHLDILAIRGLWAPRPQLTSMVVEVRELARSRGFARVVSPLLPGYDAEPYARSGLSRELPLTVYSARCTDVAGARLPDDVTLRVARPHDIAELRDLEDACFEPFWRLGEPELVRMLRSDETLIAVDASDAARGFVSATLFGSTVTLSRLAVAPGARGRGLGSALVAASVSRARTRGAQGVSLCTQEDNLAARKLYVRAGMTPLAGSHVLLLGDA